MAIYYVNINDAWNANSGETGADHANAFNYDDFETHLLAAGSSNTYKLFGLKTTGHFGWGGGFPGFTNYGPTQSHTVESEDITQPWQVTCDFGIALGSPATFKDGIVISDLIYGIGGVIYNMYLKLTSNSNMFLNEEAPEAHGCTLVTNTGYGVWGALGMNTYTDCVLRTDATAMAASGSSYINGIVYNNCVFSDINGGNPSTILSGMATFNSCQVAWVPSAAFPSSAPVTSANLLEQTFALDGSGVNDITISASGTFTGYTKGIFGGADRTTSNGIGAFTFAGAPPVTLYFRSKPSSAIASSKKFIYLPVVTGGTIDSFTITTMPSGMTLNGTTGRIEWTPASGVTTSGSLTLTAHSGVNTVDQTFTLIVNTAPRIVSTAPNLATNGSLFNYQPVVVDAENNVSGSAYSLVNAPVGMTISATTGLTCTRYFGHIEQVYYGYENRQEIRSPDLYSYV